MGIEVEYRQFSSADEQRIRDILGIGRSKGRFLKETEAATIVTDEHDYRIADALKVDMDTAHTLAKMVNKNWPAFGSAVEGADGRAESAVVYYFGNRRPKEIAGITAHELGHVADYEDTYELPKEDLRRDSFMREMVAVRHSEGKRGFEHLYTRQVQKLRELYDAINERYPARLGGKSFEELWSISGDAVQRQRTRLSGSTRKSTNRRKSTRTETQVRGLRR